MNPAFEKVKELTPIDFSIRRYSKQYYDSNQSELLKIGVPFIVEKYYSSMQAEDVLAKLHNNYGCIELSARRHADSASYSSARSYEKMPLNDYVELLISDSCNDLPYAANNALTSDIISGLGINFPTELNRSTFKDPNLWIGAKGSETPLHKDSTDNFALHLEGVKKWVVFSVHEYNNLYYTKSKYGNYSHRWKEFEVSEIDIHNIDLERFPKFQIGSAVSLFLGKGDLLYIPYGWGHYVENIERSVMINFWFIEKDFVPYLLALRASG